MSNYFFPIAVSLFVIFMCLVVGVAYARSGPDHGQATPKDAVVAYFEAIKKHDSVKALQLLSDEMRLVNESWRMEIGKDMLSGALEWEIGAGLDFEYSIVDTNENRVVVRAIELIDFTWLLGFSPMESELVFEFNHVGKISQITQKVIQGGGTHVEIKRALAPVLEWANKCGLQEDLEIVIKNGEQKFSSRIAGERATFLVRSWRRSYDRCSDELDH